jgi:hypothetical protein
MICSHHVMWVKPVARGLHQCIQCSQVVTRKDIYPAFEDLPLEFQRRWEEHEKAGKLPDEKTGKPPDPPA